MNRRNLLACAVSAWLLAGAGGCGGRDEERALRELQALRDQVAALRDSAAARFQADTSFAGAAGDTVVAVGLRVTSAGEILARAATEYLDGVRLHLRPNAIVRAGSEVRRRIGPVNARAGRWDLEVTIQRVDALLHAGELELTVTAADRVDVTIPVHVSRATGDAVIDFQWQAARGVGVVCSSFGVNEPFSGFAHRRTYRMRGHFEMVDQDGRLVAQPVVHDRVAVSPQPTEQSWQRVREILDEQNHIFRCGLALSPPRMESMLRDLLTRGFAFALPESILRPIPLPGSFLDEVEVAGRRVAIRVEPEPPRLGNQWLWLRARVHAAAQDETPIRVAP
jgi:hypothetical protein